MMIAIIIIINGHKTRQDKTRRLASHEAIHTHTLGNNTKAANLVHNLAAIVHTQILYLSVCEWIYTNV